TPDAPRGGGAGALPAARGSLHPRFHWPTAVSRRRSALSRGSSLARPGHVRRGLLRRQRSWDRGPLPGLDHPRHPPLRGCCPESKGVMRAANTGPPALVLAVTVLAAGAAVSSDLPPRGKRELLQWLQAGTYRERFVAEPSVHPSTAEGRVHGRN